MPRKILVVDDDIDIVSAIETILTLEGYTVISAYSGNDSFSLINSEKPDLLLLDYMLPDMTGADVVATLRNNSGTEDLPIVLISAAHGLRAICEKMPIQGWIEKPFELERLLTTVRQYTSQTKNTSDWN